MSKKKDEDDILGEIKQRFRLSFDHVDADYQEMVDDLTFLKGGSQWPSDVKTQRDADGRPCLEINKLPVFADQVIGDIRQNEPAIKIKPVDSKADPKTAEILTGLIRNIEVQNDAEVAYDTAVEGAIQAGLGAWRIGTHYADDDRFEQDIEIKRIRNPFTIYWDPSSEAWDKGDARFCFITEKLPKDVFEELYPDASTSPFDGGHDKDFFWGDDKNIRLVEYWKKEPIKKTLYLVQKQDVDPMTGAPIMGEIFMTDMKPDVNKLGPGWRILKERQVESHKVIWYKASASEILEGPTAWPGKYIPIIMCYGKEITIEGHSYYRGIVRNAKDPQRLYNYSRSTSAELISLAPKAPYLVTKDMIANYQTQWDQAHKKSFPYLVYEADPKSPGAAPHRAEPIGLNTGVQNEILVSDQEMHDTTGLQLASLGKKSNEKSGRAIIARQREGDVANYTFYDNLARAMKYSGKVLVDLIPKIYDTPRVVRILNRDGTDKFVPVNQKFKEPGPDGQAIEKIYDLSVGKYDVVVSIGPSYTTEREESAENMMTFMQALPGVAPMIADLVVKVMDWPGADSLEKRLKMLLPPNLQQEAGNGSPPPKPAPPDPMMIMAQQKMQMEMHKGQMEIKKVELEAQGQSLENEILFEKLQRIKKGLPESPSDEMSHRVNIAKMWMDHDKSKEKEKGGD